MTSVAVIGCGGIGCRHAQALGRLSIPADVYVVDLSAEARARSVALFNESAAATNSPARVIELSNTDELPEKLDVAILATRALHRLNALRSVLHQRSVKHLLLEKFLYARREDYQLARSLLETSSAKAWVNCPRRIYPGYRALAEELQSSRFVQLHVTGSAHSTPVGTIGIHFADLLDFFRPTSASTFAPTLRSAGLVNANRQLQDFSGLLEMELDEGRASLRFDALAQTEAPHLVTIIADNLRCIINEREQRMEISRAGNGWRSEHTPFPVPVQSLLTQLVVEELVSTQRCALTPYERSASIHLGMHDVIMAAYCSLTGDPSHEELPFT
jgi:predicted dehydrogenase